MLRLNSLSFVKHFRLYSYLLILGVPNILGHFRTTHILGVPKNFLNSDKKSTNMKYE